MKPTVLIVSNERDASVDWVVRELRRRSVTYLRLNTERLADCAIEVQPASGNWQLTARGIRYDLDWVDGVWYRRPERPVSPLIDALPSVEQDLIADQWRAVVLGLRSVSQARWINEPHQNLAAESKNLQLRLATDLGFNVPKTIITNDRNSALAFHDVIPTGVVVKALHAPLIDDPESPSFIYTTRVDRAEIAAMAGVEAAPFMLQQEILLKRDVRVTVVDQRSFAAVADPQGTVDWRTRHQAVQFVPHVIPPLIEQQCVRLLGSLGLRYGAFDFALDEDNKYFFLEVNPNGEWGWLQKTCDLPIAQAITDALLAGS